MEGHAGTYVLIVLVAALKVFDVRSQVRVDDAEAGVVENKPHCDASFVPLQENKKNKLKFKGAIAMSKYQNKDNNHIEKRMPRVKDENYFDSIEKHKKTSLQTVHFANKCSLGNHLPM